MHDLWTNPTPFPRLFLPFPTYCMFSTVMGMKGPYKKDRWDWLKNYQSIYNPYDLSSFVQHFQLTCTFLLVNPQELVLWVH